MNYPKFVDIVIKKLCEENLIAQEKGYGPFAAAICDKEGNILSITHNTVIIDNSSLCHAEINAIKDIQKKLNTYNLSKYDLSIIITAEPCSMCVGAIMWSGIKNVYFGLNSKEVERITGFDEGYKPDWIKYFANKGIKVVGNIQENICKELLEHYVNSGKVIYKI